MSRAAALYHLQLVDDKLDSARRRLAEVTALLGETPAVVEARARTAAAEQAIEKALKRQHQIEIELQTLGAKIEEVSARLYGGKVLNPKELADLQKENGSLDRRRQALEDDDLNAMIAVDEARAAHATARQEFAAAEQAWDASQRHIRDERARLEAQIEALGEERDITRSSVPAEDLALYQALRPRKGGKPVGILRDGACSCGVAPSASRVSSARSEDVLVRCGNCERILYVDLDRSVSDDDL